MLSVKHGAGRSLSRVFVALVGVSIAVAALAADPPSATPAGAAPAASGAAATTSGAAPSPAPGTAPATGSAQPAAPAAAAATGAAVDRETALAAKFTQRLDPQELVSLQADGKPFIALYEPALGKTPEGAILILPDLGEIVDQTPLLQALREVPPHGMWATLAVQLPLLPATVERKDYAAIVPAACARIKAALAHLQSLQLAHIALAGVGRGIDTGLSCLGDTLPPEIVALAGIGPWASDTSKRNLPVLDVVGGRDADAVKYATQRTQGAQTLDRKSYRRLDIDGADRRFSGAEAAVASGLRGWLDKLPPPQSQK